MPRWARPRRRSPGSASRRKPARLELLSIVEREDDIAAAGTAAETLAKNTSEIFILGVGGSSLGGQALAELAARAAPRVRFCDNLDPVTYETALTTCDLKTTRFVAISKSGTTPETMMQTLSAAAALSRAGGGQYLKHHFLVVTEPKPSALRSFAETIACPTLDHPSGIGGRYSVLSVVGLLPALLMGLDAEAVRAGARAVLDDALSGADARTSPVRRGRGAAPRAGARRALRETVLWPYADKLKTFGAWWRQLWAESLGKKGQGTTPVAALGPVDQHSQLQLFLDGPGGALFTLVATDTRGQGPEVPAPDANLARPRLSRRQTYRRSRRCRGARHRRDAGQARPPGAAHPCARHRRTRAWARCSCISCSKRFSWAA